MLSELATQMSTNIKEVPYEQSIEYPGYIVSFHPKPDGVEPREWFDVLRYYYASKGYIILHLLAAVQYERDIWDPYPLENKVKEWGIDVVYR